MASLGYSLVPGSQVLQPNISGGANPSGAHYPNPMFSSRVEAVGGCGGKNPGYNIVVARPQMGGGGDPAAYRRGGSKRRHKSKSKSKSNSKSKKHFSQRRRHHCNRCRGRCHCKQQRRQYRKRSMRAGGLSALSPLSFSAGGPPLYGGYGNQSYYGVGGVKTPLPPSMSGTATPTPITDIHRCTS